MYDNMRDSDELLGRKLAIPVILEIYENPGCMIGDVAPNTEPKWRTKYIRIHELHRAGIIKFDTEPRKHNTTLMYLTDEGQVIASLLMKIRGVMKDLPEPDEEIVKPIEPPDI